MNRKNQNLGKTSSFEFPIISISSKFAVPSCFCSPYFKYFTLLTPYPMILKK